jgi:hypothetical protein
MSIEIREVVIRATITQPGQTKAESRNPGERKAIVEECTKRVLKKLAKRSPR